MVRRGVVAISELATRAEWPAAVILRCCDTGIVTAGVRRRSEARAVGEKSRSQHSLGPSRLSETFPSAPAHDHEPVSD